MNALVEPLEYGIAVNGGHLSYAPAVTYHDTVGLTVTITADTGYYIDEITPVVMNGMTLTEGTDYTYADGTITFLTAIDGNIVMNALVEPYLFDIIVTETSAIGGSFDYAVVQNDDPAYMQGTFDIAPGGSFTITDVPYGAHVRIRSTDDGYSVIWNDGLSSRTAGPSVYVTVTSATDVTVKLTAPDDDDGGPNIWIWLVLLGIGLIIFLAAIDDDDEEKKKK
jgi:hypothetical protein